MSDYGQDFGEAFQRHILAVMCRVPGFVLRYRSALDHTFFVDKAQRTVAAVLLGHVDEQRRLPTLPTLIELVRPHVAEEDMISIESSLTKLFNADVSDSEAVSKKVVDFGKQQALINAVMTCADMLNKGNRELKPVIDRALLVGEDLLSIGTDYTATASERRKWYTDPQQAAVGIRTGIHHLDLVMQGGPSRGELCVVLAPPGRGKTTTLINIGYGALSDVQGLNVVHYSMELKGKPVQMRYDDRMMGAKVKFKKSDPEQYADEIEVRTNLLAGQLFVQDWPTRSVGVSHIRSHLAILAGQGFQPDVVIVDYADILKAERRLGDMRHEQAGIYEDLRQLAGEFDAVVWTASQASRNALEKETVTIADFAESFEKAAVVDAAFALCQTPDERIDQRMRLFAAKLRNHEDGRTIECDIRRDACFVRSIGVLDAAGTRIMGATEETAAPTTTVHTKAPAGTKTKIHKIKQATGIVPQKKYKASAAKKPAPGAPVKKHKKKDVPKKELSL